MNVYNVIDKLIDHAQTRLGLDARNAVYARNTVLALLGLDGYRGESGATCGEATAAELMRELVTACEAAGAPLDDPEKTLDAVMGALSLPPKEVDDAFALIMKTEGAARATEWLYGYAVASDYVKKERLDANPRFDAANGLVVTINKAKPEFRDAKKAASGNSVKGGYPKCTICRENEGFFGRAKRTLRTVSLKLDGEDWFWQFSPYGYFRQHGIAVNTRHIPMHVDKSTFYKLMDFVDLFPHYFIGCNAALPRIGGSVLAHDHYQGGGETLPLHKAGVAVRLGYKGYEAEVGVVDWFGTAVRISSPDRAAVAALGEIVRGGWVNYRNDALGIVPEDADGIHNAVSPTVIKTARGYEMNIILRSNITSEKYPDGVFHAHPEFHVIKKESIGLIEAQGLFILPGRLEEQLAAIEGLLVAGKGLPAELAEFDMIYGELRGMASEFTPATAHAAVQAELGSVCERILRNTAVFKTHAETAEFMKGLGFVCQ